MVKKKDRDEKTKEQEERAEDSALSDEELESLAVSGGAGQRPKTGGMTVDELLEKLKNPGT